jgi:hypothetical protein
MPVKNLREKANTCLQLSTAVTAASDRQALQDLAREYLAEADQIEAFSGRPGARKLLSLLGVVESTGSQIEASKLVLATASD